MEQNLLSRYNYFDIMARAQKGYARLLDPVCKKWDLTRNELDVLLFLANNPSLDRAADIVSHRGMAKSHVSLSISKLENRGFLVRREDPADRRTVHLSLTDSTLPITETGRMAQTRFFSYLHQDITREEIEMMMHFTQKIGENIKNIEDVL